MLNNCVKNVNNSCIKDSINSAYPSPINCNLNTINTTNWLQNQFKHQITNLFYTNFSTSNNSKFNLLNNSFTHNPQSLLLELLIIN